MTEPVEPEPAESRRTLVVERIPWTITASVMLIAVAVVIAVLGLYAARRDAQSESLDLHRQLTDQRSEAICRASYNNQVSLAIADQNIASGAVTSSLADFVIAVLKRDQAETARLQVTLADERKVLQAADAALRDAVDQQRQALANC